MKHRRKNNMKRYLAADFGAGSGQSFFQRTMLSHWRDPLITVRRILLETRPSGWFTATETTM